MSQIPISLLTLVLGVALTLFGLWLGQNNGLLPEQASVQAPLVDNFFNAQLAIAAVLYILVQGAIIWFAIQYRQRPGDDSDGVPIEGNVPLEAFWTLIPAVIVMALGIYSVDIFSQMGGFAPAKVSASATEVTELQPGDLQLVSDGEATDAESLLENKLPTFGFGATRADAASQVEVNVTGLQYAWLFDYPGYDILAGELHIPVDRPIQLNIKAQDVIHSFWVPQFRLKQDALPGQPTQLHFTATRLGTYPVVCAELCGAYHGGMRTTVVVESEEDYAAWLEENQTLALQGQQDALAMAPALDSAFADEHLHHMGLDPAQMPMEMPMERLATQ
ncbi:cytochrome c oxidase subunit II [Synechococcus sp. PCC 7336]|uniref:cytochrome c oxidase subunit II n=1 Tax=Synechococcus sp. PCC 7336 TaxID=195250 RepID=UPI0003474E96|nr:cytochrome c oxidase subunit II [Synechococcus sp. PCC 7336]